MKHFIILFVLTLTNFALADKVSDKAEFEKLYAEFNELYANSDDIDPIIEIGEKLVKLAPKAYGKRHKNVAVVTYNLASLYDEKGGDTNSKDEKKALKLYQEYFKLLDRLDAPKEQDYFEQYFAYIKSHYSVHGKNRKKTVLSKFLNAEELNSLHKTDQAMFKYAIAMLQIKHGNTNNVKELLDDALKNFNTNKKDNLQNIINIEYRLSLIDMSKKRWQETTKRLENIIHLYQDFNLPHDDILQNTYLNLESVFFYQKIYPKGKSYIKEYLEFTIPAEQRTFVEDKNSVEYLPTFRANPKYPYDAYNKNLEGFVYVAFDVDKEGFVQNVKAIASSDKIFEKSVIDATRKYKYEPYIQNGEPIYVKNMIVRIELVLG